MKSEPRMGISGRIAAAFQSAHITPLLALMALLLGTFAGIVPPLQAGPRRNGTSATPAAP